MSLFTKATKTLIKPQIQERRKLYLSFFLSYFYCLHKTAPLFIIIIPTCVCLCLCVSFCLSFPSLPLSCPFSASYMLPQCLPFSPLPPPPYSIFPVLSPCPFTPFPFHPSSFNAPYTLSHLPAFLFLLSHLSQYLGSLLFYCPRPKLVTHAPVMLLHAFSCSALSFYTLVVFVIMLCTECYRSHECRYGA